MTTRIPIRIESDDQVYYGLLEVEGDRKKNYSVHHNCWGLQELGTIIGLEGIKSEEIDWNERETSPYDFNVVRCPNLPHRKVFLERLYPLTRAQLDELKGYIR